ncbi:MAG: sigma-70 family RNA polymerase sigma factor [Ginsengibacter sp.]
MIRKILLDDSSLLDQLSTGDKQAFEEVYVRYWLLLFNAADKRLKNRQQSEDIVQNVFMGLWNKREGFKILNLEAYLFTAVRYEVLNFITRSKRTLYFHSVFEEIIIDTNTADAKILTDEMMELVLAYAQTLPAKRRCIFMEHLQTDASTKEIAHLLQISQKTVQNQLRTSLNGLFARINPIIFVILGILLQS